jgi:formimidoylglutamate deiminase
MNSSEKAWLPDLIYTGGRFQANTAIVCNQAGNILRRIPANEAKDATRLNNRAIVPGLVNAHSHAFQRVIRGRTEYRTTKSNDTFWTWREMMYSAATRLRPDDVYDASRMAFLEMALSGITAVGEFHYLHHGPDGIAYDDPNLIAKEVVRAAGDVGLRIALLRVAYARSGYKTDSNPQQLRFIEKTPDVYLKNTERLIADVGRGIAWVGIAPHSVRALPLEYLKEVIGFAKKRNLPVHMHVAEQPEEVTACIEEYGRSPVALLATEGLLSERFTGIHLIHVSPKAIRMLAEARAMACACPTTERNLGDGVVPVDAYFKQEVRVALGTDSQVQVDLLEDARELEYHLRLQKIERAVLAPANDDGHSVLAERLFDCATVNGAASIQAPGGTLEPGRPADFFTIDLDDPTIAGASPEDLLSTMVFSMSRTAVRDVVVGGKQIVDDARHAQQEEIVERFKALQKRLWD